MVIYYKKRTHANLNLRERLFYKKKKKSILYVFKIVLQDHGARSDRSFLTCTFPFLSPLMISSYTMSQLFRPSGGTSQGQVEGHLRAKWRDISGPSGGTSQGQVEGHLRAKWRDISGPSGGTSQGQVEGHLSEESVRPKRKAQCWFKSPAQQEICFQS